MNSSPNLPSSLASIRMVANSPCWRHNTLLQLNVSWVAKWRSGCTKWHSFFTMRTFCFNHKQTHYLPSFSPPSSKGRLSPSSSGSWVGRISGATTIGRLPPSPSSPGLTVLAPSPRSGAASGISVNKMSKWEHYQSVRNKNCLPKHRKTCCRSWNSLWLRLFPVWWKVIIFRL